MESTKHSAPCLALDPHTKPKPTRDLSFAPQQKLPCSPVYADIIYATNEKKFWLLSAEASDTLQECASTLDKLIAPGKSVEERQQGLYACDLLDYFLEPKLANFLAGEQKARMLEIEAQEPLIADPRYALEAKAAAEETQRKLTAKKTGNESIDRHQLAWEFSERLEEIRKKYISMKKLHEEWQQLADLARAQAMRLGYVIENGTLFTPEAIEVRTIIQTYLRERAKLTAFSVDEVARAVQAVSEYHDKLHTCRIDCEGQLLSGYALSTQEAAKFAYAAYLEAIRSAADYGIALPELALCQGSDIETGVRALKEYLTLQLQQAQCKQRMFDKYEAWIKASGENTQAPDSLVSTERTTWAELQSRLDAIYEQAKSNVASTLPRRHFLWEPEQFQPTPLQRLAKPNFPLREISWPTSGSPVRHISLTLLKGLKDNTKTNFAGNSTGKSAKDQAHSDFHEWLSAMGAVPIDDQGEWFDPEGYFEVELFHSELLKQGYQVKTLASVEQRHIWGKHLRQMLFFAGVQRKLRLFDASPQAQLIRCLAPKTGNVQQSVTTSSVFSPFGLKASASVQMEVHLARGEVELFKLDWPKRHEAEDIKLTYKRADGNGDTEMNIGSFSCHFGARAWGFAGAAALASANLALTPSNIRYGAGLSALQDAEAPASSLFSTAHTKRSAQHVNGRTAKVQIDDGAKATFNLFAGVQAGVHLTGALNWSPPKDLIALRTAALILKLTPEQRAQQTGAQWLSLARLEGNLSAAAGIGASADFALSADKGRLILRIKAALIFGLGAQGVFAFEVGYDAVYELLNLFRRELHKNGGEPLDWVDGSAADLFSKMNLLGLAGLDPQMLYLMGFDKIAELCEVLTDRGKGGLVAHTIMYYKKPAELEQWTLEAIPEALGPMFMTLTSQAKAFDVISYELDPNSDREIEVKKHYTQSQAWMLQQRAIHRLLSWIVDSTNKKCNPPVAQLQFEEACMRMNRFGTKSPKPGQSYCESRLRMDNFMAEGVQRMFEQDADSVRAKYRQYSAFLGSRMDSHCERREYHGRYYIPGGEARYKGEGQ